MEQIGPRAKDGRAVKQFFFTRKLEALYAITTGWLAPELTIRKVKVPAGTTVTLLGVKEPLTCRMVGDDLIVQVPRLMPQDLPCQHAWTLKIPGTELLPE
jgi:alpha-L-fucosidase